MARRAEASERFARAGGKAIAKSPSRSARRRAPCAKSWSRLVSESDAPAAVTVVSKRISGSPAFTRSPSRTHICAMTPPSGRSEEHTSELQSLMRNSSAVFCLKKKKPTTPNNVNNKNHRYEILHHQINKTNHHNPINN